MIPEPEADDTVQMAVMAVQTLLGGRVTRASRLPRGGNNRLVRIDRAEEPSCVVKLYFRHASDSRDRLSTEFSALRFLWENGFHAIPQPLACDCKQGLAIYSYIEGEPVEATTVAESDVAPMVELLGRLYELAHVPEAELLPPASEACFSVSALLRNLRERFTRHESARGDSAIHQAYQAFRDRRLRPELARRATEVRSCMAAAGNSMEHELSMKERTLSPSDFGFHNSLRQSDGTLVFLDFEYFGWDDPAKTLSDFVLHPGMALSEEFRRTFIRRALAIFDRGEGVGERLRLVYPLYGLKWCLILLNEFLPEHSLRRRFARTTSLGSDGLLSGQLQKAEMMLERVVREYEHYPY